MNIILGILSVVIIGAVLFIPTPKTRLEKQIKDQQVPWEQLDKYDDEKYF